MEKSERNSGDSREYLRKYENLVNSELKIVNAPVILLDVALSAESIELLKKVESKNGVYLEIMDNKALSQKAENYISQLYKNDNNTLFIFPGNGAKSVQDLSKVCKKVRKVEVFAQRYWTPGKDPEYRVGQIDTGPYLDPKTKNIVVVDDVVSSGQTMRQVRIRNLYKFPGANWYGVSWLAQLPTMRSPSGVTGYEKIFTSCLVTKPDMRKAQINSISTLIDNPEIAAIYSERNLAEPKRFIELLKELQKTV